MSSWPARARMKTQDTPRNGRAVFFAASRADGRLVRVVPHCHTEAGPRCKNGLLTGSRQCEQSTQFRHSVLLIDLFVHIY